MKKATNNIIGAVISTAVLGVAVGYGVTFWEHWKTSQNAMSGFSSSLKSTRPNPDKQGGVEPATLEAPSKLVFLEETAI